MTEAAAATMMLWIYSAVGLMVVLLLISVAILRRLRRIERSLSGGASQEISSDSAPSVAETSPGGAFESFLNEDPSRRDLSKSEQFAAYRRWRQEKGLNWSNP